MYLCQVIQDSNLRERHLGDLQGVVYGEAPRTKTKAYEALQSHGRDVEIPVSIDYLWSHHETNCW